MINTKPWYNSSSKEGKLRIRNYISSSHKIFLLKTIKLFIVWSTANLVLEWKVLWSLELRLSPPPSPPAPSLRQTASEGQSGEGGGGGSGQISALNYPPALTPQSLQPLSPLPALWRIVAQAGQLPVPPYLHHEERPELSPASVSEDWLLFFFHVLLSF